MYQVKSIVTERRQGAPVLDNVNQGKSPGLTLLRTRTPLKRNFGF
jgi:hypothetical protein